MNTITDLIKAFMILVNAGGIFRIITLIFSTSPADLSHQAQTAS